MMNCNRHLKRVVLISLLLLNRQAEAWACPAESFLNDSVKALKQAAHERSAAEFTTTITRITDLPPIALYALGPYRDQLKKPDEPGYIAKVGQLISQLLLNNAARIEQSDFKIISCVPSQTDLIVKAQVSGELNLTLKLKKSANTYVIKDASLASISFVEMLRLNLVQRIKSADGNLSAALSN